VIRVFAIAALVCAATSVAAATPRGPWNVTCQTYPGAQTWKDAYDLAVNSGAFSFTLANGTEVRTTAGMNCYATLAKVTS
jgi:hypothetical protein